MVPVAVLVVALSSPAVSYAAVASSSNALREDDETWEEFQERMNEDLDDDEDANLSTFVLDNNFLSYMYDYFKSLLLADIQEYQESSLDEVSDPDDLSSEAMEVEAAENIEAFSSVDQNRFINCVRFDVTVNGTDCTLLFPSEYRSSLYVDADNHLWNMSNSQIYGSVLYDSFNPAATEGTLVYLTPCLGNNFSTNKNYGSPNFFRRYYWTYYSGNNRLTYDDTYVTINVNSSPFSFVTSDIVQYALILIGGAILLCLLKRSLR